MKIKIGINGLGRIGRMVIRSIVEGKYNNFEIKHINNRTNSEICSNLLKYDSVHGKFNADISFDVKHLIINKNKISFSQETDLKSINWKKYTGSNGMNFGINDFGRSAPYKDIYDHFKLKPENIIKKIKERI